MLADMGADVIKVEPPEGVESRSIGPFVNDIAGPNRSLNFWYHNTNKRSLVLDIVASEADRQTFCALVASADIVLEDNAPGWLAGLGLGYDSLSADRRGLIMCAITPFGQDGPWADWKSSDLVSLALGGPMAMNGYSPEDLPGAPPIRGHGDQGYNTACQYALHGILVALLHRDRTGAGQFVDCSMHEALSCTVEVGMPYYLYMRQDVVRQTGRHAAARPTERWLYKAKDGRDLILFGVGRDNAGFAKIRTWLQSKGFGKQLDEERFAQPIDRQPGRGSADAAELYAEMGKFIAEHRAEEIYRGGQERRQSWGAVRTPEETLDDPHWHDRGFFVGVTGEGVDTPALMPGAPYIFSATPWELRRPAPKLGEHTAELLAELGLVAT